MLGTLLRMSGIPTRGDVEDLLLRWLVCGADGVEDEEHEPTDPRPRKVGNLLAEAFIHGFWSEDHDGPLLDGSDLEAVVFAKWKQAFIPRITRALGERGIAFEDRFDEEDLVERFSYHWLESVNVEKLTLPRRQARHLGTALGGNEASSTLQLWEYCEKMDKERAPV